MRRRSGRGTRGFRWATLGGFMLIAVTAALAADPAAAAGAPAAGGSFQAVNEQLPVQIQLTSVAPSALAPGDLITVSGRIRNTGASPLIGVEVVLRQRGTRLTTRAEVAQWTAGTTASLGVQLPGSVTVGRLDAGAVAPFTVRAPAGVTQHQTFGPRGIAVEVTAGTQRQRVGLYRTTVIWMPETPFEPTPVAMLVPVTSPVPSEDAGRPTPALLGQLGPAGRLTRLVEATADTRIGWAIDPAVLQAADAGTSPTNGPPGGSPPPSTPGPGSSGTGAVSPAATPSPPGTTTGAGTATVSPEDAASAVDWLDAVRSSLAGRDVATLPYADPDLVALARQGATALLVAADQRARSTAARILPTTPSPSMGWPVGGAADTATLRLLAGLGRTAVVLDGRYVPLIQERGYTPSATTQLTADHRQLRGLLYDDTLSAAFSGTGGSDSIGATQQLLSDLAALTLERPYDPRPQLLVAPRDWNPDPTAVQDAIGELSAVPWVRMMPVSALRAAAPSTLARRSPIYPAAATAAELRGVQVATMAATDHRLVQFATALLNPQPVIDPLRQRALSLVSASWRADPSGAAAARQPLILQVTALYAGPSVVHGGPFNLLTGSAHLPLRVSNALPAATRVKLTLRPRSGRLLATQPLVITLPPFSTRFVRVPVRAVADGTVQVDAQLSSLTGVPLGTTTTIKVRIHRNWEARGILALGAALACVLLAGLIRSVRRGRTRVPPADVPDIDDIELYGPSGRPGYEENSETLEPDPVDQPEPVGVQPVDAQPVDQAAPVDTGPVEHTLPLDQALPVNQVERAERVTVRPAGPDAALVGARATTTARIGAGPGAEEAMPPFSGPRLATADPTAAGSTTTRTPMARTPMARTPMTRPTTTGPGATETPGGRA